MARQNPNPYLVLGVSPTATQAEITHAYRTRLRAHHPDTRHTPPSQTADDDLRQVLAAYALLRDPARRADYDRATTLAAAPQTHRQHGPTPVDRPLCWPRPDPHHLPQHQPRCTRYLNATIAGRPGAPAPIAARFVNNWAHNPNH